MAVKLLDESRGIRALHLIKDVFDSCGLELILIGGTSLGAYRDKKFCVGDCDIDFAVLHEHFREKIMEVTLELMKKHCICKLYSYPYNYPRAMNVEVCEGVNWTRVDIMDYDLKDNIRFCAHSKKDYCLVYPVRIFENMNSTEFYGRNFKVPTPTDEYLTIHYTDSWRVPDPNDSGGRNKEWGFFGK